MPTIKLHHRIAFHALTASLVLNLVQMIQMHNIEIGKVTVQTSEHASLIESIFH